MHSASQASTGASRHDVSAMDRRKAERTFQQNVMTQVLLLSKPDPKALPDFIEIMVSHVITYRAPDIEAGGVARHPSLQSTSRHLRTVVL